MRYIKIGHGMDNHEEIINIDDISFIMTDAVLNLDKEWDCKTVILFKSGKEKKVSFSEEGYNDFIKILTLVKVPKQKK